MAGNRPLVALVLIAEKAKFHADRIPSARPVLLDIAQICAETIKRERG